MDEHDLADAEVVRRGVDDGVVADAAARSARSARPGSRDAPAARGPESRRVEGALRVEAVVHEPAHDLHVRLRLHRAAHHAERAEQPSLLQQQPGDDRVDRPPPRPARGSSGVPVDAEAGGAVLEHDPVSPARMPEPKWWNDDWISDTALRSPSTAQR